MLIHCPECDNQVSDKATNCPACGYPIKPQTVRRRSSKKRLPNGFGSITYVKDKRLRNPYLARVTVGKTDTGRPITKNLKPKAYFKSYNDAYAALLEYNRSPYSFENVTNTKEVLDRYLKHIGKQNRTVKYLEAAEREYRRAEPLYKMYFRDIRVRHLKELIENVSESFHIKVRHKQFWNQVFDFAIEYELAEHNYARDFGLDKKTCEQRNARKPHLAFTDEEMQIFWEHTNNSTVRLILIQCYMGWRPKEMLMITKDDVDLDNWTICGGLKTQAGTKRIVPVHSKIQTFIKEAYESAEGDYIFPIRGKGGNYFGYNYDFNKMMKILDLNPDHRPHDPRKQFVTMAKRFKVDEYVIKRLVGHAIGDITEAVYTERDIESLRTELEKITL